MWFPLFLALSAAANDVDDAWAARDGATLERLCLSERSGDACFFSARIKKLALEQTLASTGQDWVLYESFDPFDPPQWPDVRAVAAAYAQVARVAPKSRYADDGLAMSAGLNVHTGNARAGWDDALRARSVGNRDAITDHEVARFALYAVIESRPGADIDPYSPVPLLRADAPAVTAVHALLDQAGVAPGWREVSLHSLDRSEPQDALVLLDRHRWLLDQQELGPVLERAFDAPLREAPRRADLAQYRWHYAEQRAAGTPPTACRSLPGRSAACLAEASVEVYLDIAAGRFEAALDGLARVQRHRWADRLGLDLDATRLVLEDLRRTTQRAATERELRRIAASVDAKRLLLASAGYLPYDLDPDGLAASALDRALRNARPVVLSAMLEGQFTTFGEFLQTQLGAQLVGGLAPRRARPRQLTLYPRWDGQSPADRAHWDLLFDAVRAEGLAMALQGGPSAYEAHIRERVPGLLQGRLP
jgi:hypothetical protein